MKREQYPVYVSENVVQKSKDTSGDEFPDDALTVYSEAFNVLLKKNADYGPRNISDSPGGPLNGLLVRMHDKMGRLRNLMQTGAEPENESVRDTLLDLANYALIGMLVIDGKWPGSGEREPRYVCADPNCVRDDAVHGKPKTLLCIDAECLNERGELHLRGQACP